MNALDRARTLLELGRHREAATELSRHLTQEPGDGEALCLLAQAQLGLENSSEALRAATAAASMSPLDEWPHRLASVCLRLSGRHSEAVGAAREAVRLAPDLYNGHMVLAEALLAAGAWQQAWLAANCAVQLAPDEPDTHLTIGQVALSAHDLDTAERACLAVLALEPSHAAALNNLGLVLEQRGKLSEAARAFVASAAADPRDRGGRNAEGVVWGLFGGLQAGLAVLVVIALSKVRGIDPATLREFQAVAPALPVVVLVLVMVQLVRLPSAVRRSTLRTVRRGWGLLASLGVVVALGLLVVAPFASASSTMEAALGLSLAFLALAFAAAMQGARAHLGGATRDALYD